MMSTEQDLEDLVRAWAERSGRVFTSLEILPGDVSPRRYLRARETSGSRWIVAFYPKRLGDAGDRFRRSALLLEDVGVRVPAVEAWDSDAGIMLVEDAGPRTVYDLATDETADGFWRQGIAMLKELARLDQEIVAGLNPRLDYALLTAELDQSLELVLEPEGLAGSGGLRNDFRDALDSLCRRLDEADARPCHRDFMARNLLVADDGNLTLIDHQDLRLGPPWYDLASLLNDSLYASPSQEEALLDLAGVDADGRVAYHRAAAQRTLKIVGTFAAFARRGFDRHLALVPPSLAAARRHLAVLPETVDVMTGLEALWMDAARGFPRRD